MERKELDFAQTIQDAFVLGIKNAPSVAAAIVLWLLTIWIPYINVGTTIALSLLPVEIAKGEVINPLLIFQPKWRRYMGEYFLTAALTIIPVLIAMVFLIIPGIILSLAWSLAFYMLFEKSKNPIQALKASNDATYGSKGWIFLVSLLIGLLLSVVGGIIGGCLAFSDSTALHIIILVPVILVIQSINLATSASIWRQLKDNVE